VLLCIFFTLHARLLVECKSQPLASLLSCPTRLIRDPRLFQRQDIDSTSRAFLPPFASQLNTGTPLSAQYRPGAERRLAMEEGNGSLIAVKAKANGVNGHMNGKSHLNGHINGHAVVPRRRRPAQGPGFVARVFSILVR
jgi:hypothetical protein